MDKDPKQALEDALIANLVAAEALGIDPDDFVKCSACKQYFVSEEGDPIPCGCPVS